MKWHSPEAGQLFAIYSNAIPSSEQKPESLFLQMLEDDRYALFTSKVADVITGFALVRRLGRGDARLLEYLAVASDHRSQGLGQALFKQAAAASDTPLLIEVDRDNSRVQHFYQKLDCRQIAGLAYRMPAVSLERPPAMRLLISSTFRCPVLNKTLLRNWLESIYSEVYSRPRKDPAIHAMLAGLPNPVPLVFLRHTDRMAKVALITGANKGLGLEIARQLAHKGFSVVLGARDQAKADAAAEKLKAEGLDAHALKLDVTNADDIAAAPGFFQKNFSGLDVLVNNAGISAPKAEDRVAGLRTVFETNVFGAFALTEALTPLLKASPAGRIVNQSSILGSLATMSAGQGSEWMKPAYPASKAALNMLTIIAAHELKDTKVKVNAAHPGWVKTDMGGDAAPLDVEEGAKTAVELATLPAEGPTGAYMHLGKSLPW